MDCAWGGVFLWKMPLRDEDLRVGGLEERPAEGRGTGASGAVDGSAWGRDGQVEEMRGIKTWTRPRAGLSKVRRQTLQARLSSACLQLFPIGHSDSPGSSGTLPCEMTSVIPSPCPTTSAPSPLPTANSPRPYKTPLPDSTFMYTTCRALLNRPDMQGNSMGV